MTPQMTAHHAGLLNMFSDMLDNANRVKGTKFVNVVIGLFHQMQVVELIARLSAAAGKEETKAYVDKGTSLLTAVALQITDGMEHDDIVEATRLAEQMAERQVDFHDLLGGELKA